MNIKDLKYDIWILKMRLNHYFINNKKELIEEIKAKETKLQQLIRIEKLKRLI